MVENEKTRVRSFPESLEAEPVKRWVRDICAALSINISELSRRAKISHTTLSRFLNGRENSKHLSGTTLAAIATVVREAEVEGLVETIKSGGPDVSSKVNTFVRDVEMSKRGQYIANLGIARFIGKGIRQSLSDTELYDPEAFLRIPLPRHFRDGHLLCYELREEDNSKFPNGSVLVCLHDPLVLSSITPGMFCVGIKAIKGDADAIEACIYEIAQDPRRHWWLLPTWAKSRQSDALYVGEDLSESFRGLLAGPLSLNLIVTSVIPQI